MYRVVYFGFDPVEIKEFETLEEARFYIAHQVEEAFWRVLDEECSGYFLFEKEDILRRNGFEYLYDFLKEVERSDEYDNQFDLAVLKEGEEW